MLTSFTPAVRAACKLRGQYRRMRWEGRGTNVQFFAAVALPDKQTDSDGKVSRWKVI
jgi:hypothetical protein